MSKYNVVTQKQNNADFDQKKAEYQSALDKYQGLLSSVDTLNPKDIIQGLRLSGTAGKTTETVLQPDDGTAINGIAHWYSHNMNGAFLEVHYSDITGAYYTDMNGATHPIKSVNITYSNLIIGKLKDGRYAYIEPAQGGAWAGLDSFYIKSVDATYEFYDENNQKISFDPGTAWFFLSSLTRWPNNNDGNAQVDPAQDHVEAVQALNGSKLYNIPGGKAKVHANGNAYADPTDAIQHREPYHSYGNGDNIYDHDGGAVLASVSNGMTLKWNLEQNYDPNTGKDVSTTPSLHIKPGESSTTEAQKQDNAKDGGWYYWQVRNDALSNFSLIPPIRKTSSIHYHYDVAQTTFQAEQYTILNAFLHIYYT